ncbi:MAG: hypothetical protein ACKO4S_11430 [Snowella sp.]
MGFAGDRGLAAGEIWAIARALWACTVVIIGSRFNQSTVMV